MDKIIRALIRITEANLLTWQRQRRPRGTSYSTLLGDTVIRITRTTDQQEETFHLVASDQEGTVGTLETGDMEQYESVIRLFSVIQLQQPKTRDRQDSLLSLIEGYEVQAQEAAPETASETAFQKTVLQTLGERHCTCVCCCSGQCDPGCR